MEKEKWTYDKLDSDGNITSIYADFVNDTDGHITGHIVMNVHAYFNENPEEWKRLGYIKHILHDEKEIDYNKQTQFLTKQTVQIDDYTIEDKYFIIDKSEEQLAFEEMLAVAIPPQEGIYFM